MENTLTLELPFPEAKIRNIVAEELTKILETRFPKENKLVPRIDAAKRIGISVVTFDTRAKEGLFKTQKIGGKVFITDNELTRIIEGSRYSN